MTKQQKFDVWWSYWKRRIPNDELDKDRERFMQDWNNNTNERGLDVAYFYAKKLLKGGDECEK